VGILPFWLIPSFISRKKEMQKRKEIKEITEEKRKKLNIALLLRIH
jgi:predicted DNA-binding ribbon-helix-helix protein